MSKIVKFTVGQLQFQVTRLPMSKGTPMLADLVQLSEQIQSENAPPISPKLMAIAWAVAETCVWLKDGTTPLPMHTLSTEGERDIFDSCFDDDYAAMLMWLAECAEVHFGRFLGTLGLKGSPPELLKAKWPAAFGSPSTKQSGSTGE